MKSNGNSEHLQNTSPTFAQNEGNTDAQSGQISNHSGNDSNFNDCLQSGNAEVIRLFAWYSIVLYRHIMCDIKHCFSWLMRIDISKSVLLWRKEMKEMEVLVWKTWNRMTNASVISVRNLCVIFFINFIVEEYFIQYFL